MRSDIKRNQNESFGEYITRVSTIATELQTLSDGHIRWFTHKNPYGCWICDMFQVFQEFITEIFQEEEAELNRPSPQATTSNQDEEQGES